MQNEKTDVLLVSFHREEESSPIMIIARKAEWGKLTVLNAFSGNDAEDMYALLLDGKEKYEAAEKTDS